jgi:hypothetical protein
METSTCPVCYNEESLLAQFRNLVSQCDAATGNLRTFYSTGLFYLRNVLPQKKIVPTPHACYAEANACPLEHSLDSFKAIYFNILQAAIDKNDSKKQDLMKQLDKATKQMEFVRNAGNLLCPENVLQYAMSTGDMSFPAVCGAIFGSALQEIGGK